MAWMQWDVFCRVIDNLGDIGVAWRLAADLAERGERLRLWVDDASALAFMAPDGHPGVELVRWAEEAPDLAPSDVVVECFGCDPPPRFVRRMAERSDAPAWINLEHLSAELYVERNHGLPSPVLADYGRLLTKHFYYPGFTARSGGLIREAGVLTAQDAFDRIGWLSTHGIARAPGERLVSLFCYANPALPALLDQLADAPTLLLATHGAPAAQITALLGPAQRRGALRTAVLPWLRQAEYDRLLWACDLNFVRGEDSLVRAQWAGKPFVWQAYPQHDGVHANKLHAFLDRHLAGAPEPLAESVRRLALHWNGLGRGGASLPALAPWRKLCERWRDGLLAQPDLGTQLMAFVTRLRQ